MSDEWVERTFERDVVPGCPPGGMQTVVYRYRRSTSGTKTIRPRRWVSTAAFVLVVALGVVFVAAAALYVAEQASTGHEPIEFVMDRSIQNASANGMR